MQSALLIFIKNPSLGRVKRRLATTVGEVNALKIYQHLLDHTLEITYQLEHVDKYVFYDNFIPTKDQWPLSDYTKELQQGKDLAEKMANGFKKAFDDHFHKVILVMPDCPKLTDTIIERAFRSLDTHDFVIGPSNDGGYYLLGMKKFTPAVFEGKEYSTERVFEEAVAEFDKAGGTYTAMPMLVDIDREEDLGKLHKLIDKGRK